MELMLDKRQVRRAFGRAVRNYDAVAALQRRVADELVGRLQWMRTQPQRILDVGTGTGYCLRLLTARYRRRALGLDLALPMLERARAQSRWWRRPRLICGDAEQLPLGADTLDLVVSSLALQWCNVDRALAEFHRVLAPGGLVLFATFGPDTLREVRSAWASVDERPHVHPFADMHDLGAALMRAGFEEPVLDVDRLTVRYPDARAVLRDLRALGAVNAQRDRFKGLTGKQRFRRFEQALEAGRCDGVLPVQYEVVYGSAWRPTAAPGAGSVHPLRWQPRA